MYVSVGVDGGDIPAVAHVEVRGQLQESDLLSYGGSGIKVWSLGWQQALASETPAHCP